MCQVRGRRRHPPIAVLSPSRGKDRAEKTDRRELIGSDSFAVRTGQVELSSHARIGYRGCVGPEPGPRTLGFGTVTKVAAEATRVAGARSKIRLQSAVPKRRRLCRL